MKGVMAMGIIAEIVMKVLAIGDNRMCSIVLQATVVNYMRK
jgi:hypothetical protein